VQTTPLNASLIGIRRSILAMSAAVEELVREAFDLFLDRDAAGAEAVIRRDRSIDEMDVRVESECVTTLARYQPVARDLRFVLAVLRIENDLERIADLAKGIAKRTIDDDHHAPIERPAALSLMIEHTTKMFSDALRALADRDADLARQVRASDQIVDDLQTRIYEWATMEIPANTQATAAAISVLSVTRAVERIADLSTNIGEDVIFMIEGRIVRHTKV
jgi:phosphate transport system protein